MSIEKLVKLKMREKMIELINGVLKHLPWGEISSHTAEDIANYLIDNDVVPVVRCKNCEFCLYNSSNDTYRCKSMRGMYRAVMADEFCSWGERKDSE